VGNKVLKDCTGCNSCFKNRNEKCIIDDEVNEWIQKMKEADGIILGSPVHFSSISASMKAFLDRAMYVVDANKTMLKNKVGASVISVRRSGGVAAFNQLNNYIFYSQMLMPASNYWNVIHGNKPGEVLQDEEGVQTMRILGRNMAWLLKIVELGKDKIEPTESERKIYTNFIR